MVTRGDQTAVERPDVFGLVLAESPSLLLDSPKAWEDYLAAVKQWPRKVYLGVGGAETGRFACGATGASSTTSSW